MIVSTHNKIREVATAIETGKIELIENLVYEVLDTVKDPNVILNEGMIATMGVVGVKFQVNEIFIPELLNAAKTMKKGVDILKLHLVGTSSNKYGKYIIGTVEGDLHDIGKKLVGIMIESIGFELIDLGVDVPAEKFIETIKDNPECRVVGISTLLTTTMETLMRTVKEMIDAGCKSQVKIMVGGAPITQEFADMIGADAYAPDAGSAANKAVELVN